MDSRPVAVYKAYRGGEWLEASLESVWPFVQGMAVALSKQPWCDGAALPENCLEPLLRFQRAHPGFPIIVRCAAWRTQEEQYASVIELAREQFGEGRLVLLVDTDEIWDASDLARLIGWANTHPHAAYEAGLWTYVKQPTWRVTPPEPCSPTVLVDTAKAPRLTGVRGGRTPDRCRVPDVRLHHFSYVRAEEADIRLKFVTSAVGDGVPSRPDWFETVWNWLPHVRNFHPSIGYEKCWRELETVSLDDLPAPARPVAQKLLEAPNVVGPIAGDDRHARIP